MRDTALVKPTMTHVRLQGDMLEVGWQGQNSQIFHPIWLRDNCRCEHCGDPAIGRRHLHVTDIDLNIKPVSQAIIENRLHIRWPDQHESCFTAQWLLENGYDDHHRREQSFRPPLWDEELRTNPPRLDFETVNQSDSGLLLALQNLRDHGLCFIENAPAIAGTLEKLTVKIGYPQTSNFGCVQDLVFDRTKASIANDIQALKPHTDEPYRASPPGILLFHCIDTDVNGAGYSLFIDGFEIAEQLRLEDPEGFEALIRYPQSFRRHFEGDVDLISKFPMISVDEFGHVNGVRINDRVAAPLSISADAVAVYYRGLKQLLTLAEDESRTMQLKLRPGDIAIFDNHRILHGRTQLTINGKRWLQWIQIERGDFYSTLRILSDKLGQPRDAKPLLRGSYG